MSDLKDRIQAEADELRSLRDELRVQIHLAKLEAQERYEAAEKSWEHLEAKLNLLASETRASAQDVGDAARLLLDEIREGYEHVRKLV